MLEKEEARSLGKETHPGSTSQGLHDPAADQFRLPFDAISLHYQQEHWREDPVPAATDIFTIRVLG